MLANVIYPALWLLQEGGQPAQTSDTMVKVVCGVGAVVLLAIVIIRRKSKKKQDEF